MFKKTLFTLGCLAISSAAFGHATTQPKDTLDAFSDRNYKEGSSAYVNLQIPHGCDDNGTIAAVAVMSNGASLTGVGFTQSGANKFPANAIMNAAAVTDANWKLIRLNEGTVPAFGSTSTTVNTKSILWAGGYIPPHNFTGLLTFRASLPRLDGCVSTLRINIPIIQYCEKQTAIAWTGEVTTKLPAAIINPGFYPFINVVRDTATNPLPAECNGQGTNTTSTPSTVDIDAALPPAHPLLIQNSL